MAGINDGFKVSVIGIIPGDWDIKRLDKICDVRDGTHDSPKYIICGIPLITSKNLKANGIDFSEINYISEEDHAKISQRSKVDDGDIIFAMIGTIGNPVIVKKTFDFSIKNIALVKFPNRHIDNRFIHAQLKSTLIEKQFSDLMNGGVQKFVSLASIRSLFIPLPPLPEQQKIADILTTVDDHINETEALIEKTKILKQGLMQQLLTKGIGHTEFKDTEIGRIPVGWEVESADELFENVSIKNYPSERILTITQEFGAVYRDESGMDIQSSEKSWGSFKLVCPGNFVISLRSFQGGIEYSKLRGIVSPAYTVLKSKKIICEDYFRYYFKSSDFIHDLSSSVIGIRDGKQISFSVFSKISLPLPPLPEQHQIAAILTSVDDQIDTYQAKLTSLTRLKTGLMQQLLTGKIRVKV